MQDICIFSCVVVVAFVTTVAGGGSFNSGADGYATQISFSSLQGIDVDSTGRVFIVDEQSRTIRYLSASGNVFDLFARIMILHSQWGICFRRDQDNCWAIWKLSEC